MNQKHTPIPKPRGVGVTCCTKLGLLVDLDGFNRLKSFYNAHTLENK